MCLLLLAWRAIPGKPWLMLANRDEFHARASTAVAPWPEEPDIVGGRDLVAGGSWLALHRNGRFASVTNVRSPGQASAPRSRGALVADFVRAQISAEDYAAGVAARRAQYGPFNLVAADPMQALFVSSIDGVPRRLEPGIHAFSNGSREDEWPKMRRLRQAFSTLVSSRFVEESAMLDLLHDTTQPLDAELPDTGVGPLLERMLAPIFIVGDAYGTRASTLAYARDNGSCVIVERRFGANGAAVGETRIDTAG
jgi:uncharacterized protein with NRDE domain